MRKQAFTLIELMVVISIIALLIGVLLPALGAARGAARTSVCASQERQVLIGFHNFSVDHDGFLPPGVMSFSASAPVFAQPWDDTIHEYINGSTSDAGLAADSLDDGLEQEVLVCPSDRADTENDNAVRSYAMPGQDPSNPVALGPIGGPGALMPTQLDSDDDDDLLYLHCLGMWIRLDQRFLERGGFDVPGTQGGVNLRGNFGLIINAHGDEMVRLDVDVLDPSGTFALCEYPRVGPDYNQQSSGSYALVPGPAYLMPETGNVTKPHGGNDANPVFNFGYADGHVETEGAFDTLGEGATLEDQFPLGAWSMRRGD